VSAHTKSACGSLTFPGKRVSLFGLKGARGNALSPTSSNQVTELLQQWSNGDSAAREKLVPLVYDELRRMARNVLSDRGRDATLQSTALVHEAYLRLVGHTSVHWDNRLHFFAVAAQLMRRILIDHVRMERAQKRGGESVTLVLDEAIALPAKREVDLVALDDALTELAALDERQCRLVELRFFGGLTIEETAQALEISPATVKREWATARLWLLREISRHAQA
jgi:RNA polymerase sigma-70 factor, ECF subfamily